MCINARAGESVLTHSFFGCSYVSPRKALIYVKLKMVLLGKLHKRGNLQKCLLSEYASLSLSQLQRDKAVMIKAKLPYLYRKAICDN